MTWLDEAVSVAEGCRSWQQTFKRPRPVPVSPERFLALAEVVKAAEPCADWNHITREDSRALDAALVRLDEL